MFRNGIQEIGRSIEFKPAHLCRKRSGAHLGLLFVQFQFQAIAPVWDELTIDVFADDVLAFVGTALFLRILERLIDIDIFCTFDQLSSRHRLSGIIT